MNIVTRYIFVTLAATLISSAVQAQTPDNLPGACSGYLVVDLRDGHTVASHNADRSFVPASTLKCVTLSAALSRLGPGYSFKTDIRYTGAILSDTIFGSLIVEGTGDPSVDSTICREIAEHGIAGVRGRVETNTGIPLVSPSVMKEDIGTDYGVGWSRFNYCNNRALINEEMLELPGELITDDLTSDLYNAGISVDGQLLAPADTMLLFTHTSCPLAELCRHMMYESDNLYAESIGRSLSPDSDISSAIDSIKTFLNGIGINQTGVKINDMSGLARTNLVTPRFMAALLSAMADDTDYVSCFPTAGRTGTVKRLLSKTRLEGRLRLKSGSMSGVLSYAGYMTDSNGRPTHAVVVIVNNATCKHSQIRQCIEKWLLNIFNVNVVTF